MPRARIARHPAGAAAAGARPVWRAPARRRPVPVRRSDAAPGILRSRSVPPAWRTAPLTPRRSMRWLPPAAARAPALRQPGVEVQRRHRPRVAPQETRWTRPRQAAAGPARQLARHPALGRQLPRHSAAGSVRAARSAPAGAVPVMAPAPDPPVRLAAQPMPPPWSRPTLRPAAPAQTRRTQPASSRWRPLAAEREAVVARCPGRTGRATRRVTTGPATAPRRPDTVRASGPPPGPG